MDVRSYIFFSTLLVRAAQRGILFMEDYSTGNDGEHIAIVYSWSPRGTVESRAHYSFEQNRWPRALNFDVKRGTKRAGFNFPPINREI